MGMNPNNSNYQTLNYNRKISNKPKRQQLSRSESTHYYTISHFSTNGSEKMNFQYHKNEKPVWGKLFKGVKKITQRLMETEPMPAFPNANRGKRAVEKSVKANKGRRRSLPVPNDNMICNSCGSPNKLSKSQRC